MLGSHGVGRCNANGELLFALCSEYNIVITNTLFKHKDTHKKTWIHPRSKHWHLFDYIIKRQGETTLPVPSPVSTQYPQHQLAGQDPGHQGAGEGTAPQRHHHHARGTDTLGRSRIPNVRLQNT